MKSVKNFRLKLGILLACAVLAGGLILSWHLESDRKRSERLREKLAENLRRREELIDFQLSFARRREEKIRSAMTRPLKQVSQQTTTSTTVPGRVVEVRKKPHKKTRTS